MAAHENYQLVIFDFDGTLADSLLCLANILNRFARKYGFREIQESDHDSLRTLNTRQLIRALEIPIWVLPTLLLQVRSQMALEIRSVGLFPGVAPMLAQLAESNLPLGLVSSNSWANISAVLGPDLARLFAHVECEASLFGKRSKLRRVLRSASVAPERAIYIGDELRDLKAAHAENIAFGGVIWGHSPAEQLESHRPEFIFHSREDVTAQLILR